MAELFDRPKQNRYVAYFDMLGFKTATERNPAKAYESLKALRGCMNNIQKWLIVLAIWVLAVGVLLNAFHGRYKMGKVSMESAQKGNYLSVRFDTWTGEVQVQDNPSGRWVRGSSIFVEELK